MSKTIDKIMKQIGKLTEQGNMEAVNKLVDVVDRLTKEGEVTTQDTGTPGKYLYARELTLTDGTKHYHPLIGGMYPSGNKEDYKMEAYDNILDLQDSEIGHAVEGYMKGYNMKIIFVPNNVYAELEKKLDELLTGVWDHLGTAANAMSAAAALLNIQQSTEEAMQKQAETLFKEPLVAGTGVTRDNKIVDRTDYIDEEVGRNDTSSDDECDDDGDDGCEGCPCCTCPETCGSRACYDCSTDGYCSNP